MKRTKRNALAFLFVILRTMCGIFAYTGTKQAAPILLDGLRALEYRGYDSAGLFTPKTGAVRAVGKVENLAKHVSCETLGVSGVAHTRWATHGAPTEENTHPHADCTGSIQLVHNGIIENYQELKGELEGQGHIFRSSTDSEVLAHLVETEMLHPPEGEANVKRIEEALSKALSRVRGTYGVAVLHTAEPEKIVAARLGSPIIVGTGDGEHFIASDASAILKHTKNVVYINDGEMAVITPEHYTVMTLAREQLDRAPDTIDWSVEDVKKGGYPHFMLKEIMEGADVVRHALRGRVVEKEGRAQLGGLSDVADQLREIDRLIIVGCGSAYYAGLAGEYMIEEFGGVPVEVEYASEYRYRKPILGKNTAVLAISQSGETADTLAALREAKQKGALTLGIVNVVGSTISRETDAGVYNHAGPEIGVASTKAFLSQMAVLALFALFLGRQRGLSLSNGQQITHELAALPEKIERVLEQKDIIKDIAEQYAHYNNFLYIGRKYNFPMSLEGALKLKEISYIHAEGYGAGEMKHGPIAMIDENFPIVAIAPRDSVYEKNMSNIEELRARNGRVLAVATEGDEEIKRLAADVIYIPEVPEMLSPILSAIPLHLFAYYIGVSRGYDVDKPRNLAKSVTVE